MIPGGVIISYMRWDRPRWWVFNACLLLWQIMFLTIGKLYGKVDVAWRQIWRAATAVHVRLVLKQGMAGTVITANFTAPEMTIEQWKPVWNDNKRFGYRQPTFDITPEEVAAMINFAYAKRGDPVARKYDYLQTVSFMVNLPFWIVYPPCWGREVIKVMNLAGGREVCSTGVTSILIETVLSVMFFGDYDTAMVSPCLYVIDGNWEEQ